MNAAILRVLGGDLDSFADVVKSYQVSVRNFVASTFPWASRIDELVQEIFIRAFRGLSRYEPGQPFWPWLKGIAQNVVYEELRAEGKRARERKAFAELALLREAEQAVRSGDAEPSDSLGALRECLKEHPEEGSRLLRWFYVEKLTSDAIAVRLGCGASAVRNALMRVRRALRDCVERRIQEEPV